MKRNAGVYSLLSRVFNTHPSAASTVLSQPRTKEKAEGNVADRTKKATEQRLAGWSPCGLVSMQQQQSNLSGDPAIPSAGNPCCEVATVPQTSL